MAEPINLRQARKAKARREKDGAAEATRAKHGETKASRALREARTQKELRAIDAHKRDRRD